MSIAVHHSLRQWRILSLACFITIISPAQSTTPQILPIQPLLLRVVAETPEREIGVIVQKTMPTADIATTVHALGGIITADLHIINGFAATLPAHALPGLARIPGVRWVSFDAPNVSTSCHQCIDVQQLQNTYIHSVRADQAWNQSPYVHGEAIGIAVVDSGINLQEDFYTIMGQNRLVAAVAFHNGYNASTYDGYGHGSHVAGVIGGNGRRSQGKYIGVAPMANIINVKVGDDLNQGQGTARTVVQGLQWILENKDHYNIRVVNLSLNSAIDESYHTSPINAAVEVLWFNKIVVVASAGNMGNGKLYPPANDPFIITVGATDEHGTSALNDDQIAHFSAYGNTIDGFTKPDIVAPGVNIVGPMGNHGMGMARDHSDHIVDNSYFRLSGTSAAAPIVAGAAALLLQDEPQLTPDQVKYRLMATANKNWPGYQSNKAGAGYVDVYAAIHGTTTQSANIGTTVSQLLQTGSEPITWGSVSWNSVSWNSVSWNSVSWNSDYWGN